MVAKYKKFGVADAGRPRGEAGSPYREHVILDLPATRSIKARDRKRPNKSPHMAGYRTPADGNIETYPGRRVERIAISIESPGAAPGWHHDAVNVLVAVMGDAAQFGQCFSSWRRYLNWTSLISMDTISISRIGRRSGPRV
jgi:hypothetical protein